MPSTIAVITDSSSTIKANEYKDVFVVPMAVIVNDQHTYRDGVEIDSKQLVDMITPNNRFVFRNKTSAKTSMPSPHDFIDAVTKAAKAYQYVVCLPLSSGLSGTFNSWQTLLKQPPLDQYTNVMVLETSDTALSLKWLVENILAIIENGGGIDEVKKCVSEWPNRIDCAVVLDNLDQLVSGGRIRKIQAMVTSLLKIRPVIRFHYKNEFLLRAFSNRAAIEKSVDTLTKNLNINSFDDLEKVGLASTFLNEEAEKTVISELLKCLQTFFKKELKLIKTKFFTAIAPAVIAAHTGIDAFSIQLLRK